jgi:CRP-like cAMP-binding protein
MPCLISHTMKSIHDEWARGVPCDLERTDAQLSAALEALPGLLDTAAPSDLERGRQAASAALGALDPEDAQPTQDFLAGRLSAIVDLLGYAATQTADPAAIAFARAAPFSDILVLLAENPLRNTDLAQHLDRDKAQVSKWLAALREAGLVHSHRRGRELYNQLTPLARLIAPASTSTDSEVIS